MAPLDRIVVRPHIGQIPAHWLFKTSEGVKGPFASLEMAKQSLEIYVLKCVSDGKAGVNGAA